MRLRCLAMLLLGTAVAGGAQAIPTSAPQETKSDPSTMQPPDARVAQALRAANRLQSAVRDPDSLVIEHVYTRISDTFPFTAPKGVEMTCIEYRARNGFGGMNRAAVLYWEHKNKFTLNPAECSSKKYTDITSAFVAAWTPERQSQNRQKQ
jgi:hypothetical protein